MAKRNVIGHTYTEAHKIAWDTIYSKLDYYQKDLEAEGFETIIERIVKEAVSIAQDYGASAVRRAYDDYCDDLEGEIDELKGDKKDLEREIDKLNAEIEGLKRELKEAQSYA